MAVDIVFNNGGAQFADGTVLPSGGTLQQQSIGASVASNALTVNYNGGPLAFRNATLTTGTPVNIQVGALSLVVPSTATLGTVATIQAQLALLVAYNSGSPVLCVVNMAGGVNLDETTLISPTTISTGATSASVIYSSSSVGANSPFRVVGYINITEATAGTWLTAPTLVQGYGGQAMAAMQSLGFGQTWQNLTGGRAVGTTYYNTTNRPITVAAAFTNSSANTYFGLTINGVSVYAGANNNAGQVGAFSIVVPPNASYVTITNTGTLNLINWDELR